MFFIANAKFKNDFVVLKERNLALFFLAQLTEIYFVIKTGFVTC